MQDFKRKRGRRVGLEEATTGEREAERERGDKGI